MDITTRNFFRLLRAGAFGDEVEIEPLSAWKWKRLYQLSIVHHVSALVFDGICRCQDQFFLQLPEGLYEAWRKATLEAEEENRHIASETAALFSTLGTLQLRPILLKGQSMSTLYDQPYHRMPGDIDIFFPFDTQGQKADQWALDYGEEVEIIDKRQLTYHWNGVKVEHHHRMQRLTNKLLEHLLQGIVEQEMRETQAAYVTIDHARIETVPPTLSLLLILLRIARYVLSDGISLKQIVDLGIFLRKQGDRADYVKLQQWLQRLKMERMARLAGAMLTGLLGFADDEIPFVEGVTGSEGATKSDLSLIMKEIASLGQPHRSEWNFQQADSIFVHTTNTTAMFWQVRHSARYFRYCPSESLTSLLYTFAHSLSHVEE